MFMSTVITLIHVKTGVSCGKQGLAVEITFASNVGVSKYSMITDSGPDN